MMKKRKEQSPPKKKRLFHRKHGGSDTIIRIEDLEKIMGEYGEDVDPETIVSMYMPHRRARQFGAILLSLDRMHLLLLGLLATVGILFVMAFVQEKMGNFTVNLNRLEMFRKGISIAEDGDFTNPTARLTASALKDVTNITYEDLPADLDEYDGNHNGQDYMAYTYYVRNAGKIDVGYLATVTLDACAKGAENAVRVKIWKNGVSQTYAMPSKDGTPEEGCENFLDEKRVCEFTEENFLVGNVDKYTIVIWLEGEDPECVDDIVGGSIQFSMDIDALSDDDTSLVAKFVQDVKDTLTGNKPIDAAGTTAPDYYSDTNITWENRRNQ